MNKSDYLREALLNHTLRGVVYTPPTDLYVALYTTPCTSSTPGDEVAGASYIRQAATFSVPDGDFVSGNTGALNFPTPTEFWGELVSAALWDAETGGNMLYFGALATSKVVDVGNAVLFPAGYFNIRES